MYNGLSLWEGRGLECRTSPVSHHLLVVATFWDDSSFCKVYNYQLYLTTKKMGSSSPAAVRMPLIAKQHWHEVPLPPTILRKVSHGQYKLFSNVLTNQKIEQYSIIFQSSEEHSQYVESFVWRQREESIINTKYFENVREDTFCGTRIYAKIYLEHTPYRLSSINQIPLPENLYVLASALAGFQKLYGLIGYFRPSEDMVGIDGEGRVKVWLNNNFSRNYLYGPHYVQGKGTGSNTAIENLEERMVLEIIGLVEQNTAYGQGESFPTIRSYLEERKCRLTFQSVQKEITAYSKRFNLVIPRYFISLLHVLQDYHISDEDDLEAEDSTINPFQISQSNIVQNTSHIIHYIDPELNSNHQGGSNNQILPSEKELKSLTRIQQEFIELPREGDTTGETFVKNSFKSSRIGSNQTARKAKEATQGNLPPISFKYTSRTDLQTPLQSQPTSNLANCDLTTPEFHLPLSQIAENTLLQSIGLTKRMTYSDINQDYELDEQLAQDLVKYCNN